MQAATFFWEGIVSTLCNATLDVQDVVSPGPLDTTVEGGVTVLAQSSGNVSVEGKDLYSSSVTWALTVDMVYDPRYYPFDIIEAPVSFRSRYESSKMVLRFSEEQSGIVENFSPMTGLALLPPKTNITRAGGRLSSSLVVLPSGVAWGQNRLANYTSHKITYALERSDKSDFAALMLPTYLAFFISVIALSMPVDDGFGNRLGVLTGAVFAIVLNIQAVNSNIGLNSALTLSDVLNFTTLVLIAISFLETAIEGWLLLDFEARRKEAISELDAASSEETLLLGAEKPSQAADGRAVEEIIREDQAAESGGPTPEHSSPSKKAKATRALPRKLLFPTFRHRYYWMSMWTLVFCVVSFFAINIAFLGFYRPEVTL